MNDYEIRGRRFAKYFRTGHGDAIAHTAVHSIVAGRSIGGCRFVKTGSLAELGHLAVAMTGKCEIAGIEAGGQKSLIVCGDRLPSEERRAEILAEHAAFVVETYPGAIFGPDMNASEEVMDRVAGVPGLLKHVTGLSDRFGGLAIDMNGYTAIGIEEAVNWWLERADVSDPTVSIQGFGAVGAHTARLLDACGTRVVGVSNRHACITGSGGAPLPIPPLFEAWRQGGDTRVVAVAHTLNGVVVDSDPGALFAVPCSVFVPAARVTVFAAASELEALPADESDALDVEAFLDRTGVRCIVEAANHPLSYGARAVARARGVMVLEDISVNLGGLVGCFEEWKGRANGRPVNPDELGEVGRRARASIRAMVARNLSATSDLSPIQ